MKGITRKKREIKLKNLLYKEYLEQKYIVYDYQKYRIKVRKDTDGKWKAQKFISNE